MLATNTLLGFFFLTLGSHILQSNNVYLVTGIKLFTVIFTVTKVR